jgi:uncharacterized membrane protein
MTIADHWTIVVMVGLVFSFLNLRYREENIRALRERGMNGGASFMAKWLRNNEAVRAIQLIVLFLIGIAVVAVERHWTFVPESYVRWAVAHIGEAFLVFAYAISYNSAYSFFKSRKVKVLSLRRKEKDMFKRGWFPPKVDPTKVMSAILLLIGLAATLGFALTDAQGKAVTSAVSTVISLLTLLGVIRPNVTPSSSPMDVDGTPLVRPDGSPPKGKTG